MQTEAVDSNLPSTQRPFLRGVSHLFAAVAAIVGAAMLLWVANRPQEYVGAAIFSGSLILLYSTSAIYHLIRRNSRIRSILRRVDHSMIFVLIAGTYTPFCLLAFNLAWGVTILAIVGSLAGAGILVKLAWPNAPRWLRVTLYVAIGWTGLVAAPEVFREFTTGALALLVLGGALYTLGGTIYAARKPRLWPQVFSYHEVFHLLVISGSALHYWLVALYLQER